MKLPDCMMPDGAEPCKGYLELQSKLGELQDQHAALVTDHQGARDAYEGAMERALEAERRLRSALKLAESAAERLDDDAIFELVEFLRSPVVERTVTNEETQ